MELVTIHNIVYAMWLGRVGIRGRSGQIQHKLDVDAYQYHHPRRKEGIIKSVYRNGLYSRARTV